MEFTVVCATAEWRISLHRRSCIMKQPLWLSVTQWFLLWGRPRHDNPKIIQRQPAGTESDVEKAALRFAAEGERERKCMAVLNISTWFQPKQVASKHFDIHMKQREPTQSSIFLKASSYQAKQKRNSFHRKHDLIFFNLPNTEILIENITSRNLVMDLFAFIKREQSKKHQKSSRRVFTVQLNRRVALAFGQAWNCWLVLEAADRIWVSRCWITWH